MNYLDDIVSANKNRHAHGITSVCSAHPFVLEATLRHGLATSPHTPVLIEATCNQVNQSGGYTGMQPQDFVRFVGEIADRVGYPRQNLILGGDHLGPLVWASKPAEFAMEKAKILVRDYVHAGFAKIHLDCSMPCADDQQLPTQVIARRAAELAAVAESASSDASFPPPRYVIGSEVPPAGGAKAGKDQLAITNPVDAAEAVELTHQAFSALGLDSAWERVIALVVQPGVEFGDDSVHDYDRSAAASLARFIETIPGLIYEAHSTDYQTRPSLRFLVEDHFAILKVGPGLTYAFRQAVFALAAIEELLVGGETSKIAQVIEAAMLENPSHWQKHYHGSPKHKHISRIYSYSDRIRYYWNLPAVQTAFSTLLKNLGEDSLPLTLLSEYMPVQYKKIRSGAVKNQAHALISAYITDVLDNYSYACGAN